MTQAVHDTPMSPFGKMLFDAFAPSPRPGFHYQPIEEKVQTILKFEAEYASWSEMRRCAFPNADFLHTIYERSSYDALKEWEKQNPAPRPELCKHCYEPYSKDEHRWCCNPACSHYLL